MASFRQLVKIVLKHYNIHEKAEKNLIRGMFVAVKFRLFLSYHLLPKNI